MNTSIHSRRPRAQLSADELESLRAYQRVKMKEHRKRCGSPGDRAIGFVGIECSSSRPTSEMMDAAARRACEPRSLSAQILGDPPPSQSALARRVVAT